MNCGFAYVAPAEAEMRSQLFVGAAFAFGVELAHMRNYVCLFVSHQHL